MDRRSFLRTGAVVGSAAAVTAVASSAVTRVRTQDADAAAFASSVAQQAVRGTARVWWSGSGAAQRVALTFDDGPTEQFTAEVLDLLRRVGVTATFFVIGELVQRHPDLVRRARDEGHELANHGFDHLSAVRVGADRVREAMARGADAVERVGGTRPRWFRPPRGEITSATLLAARELHQDVALWSVVRNGPDGGAADDDQDGVRRHLTGALHPGAVVDLHDGIGRSAWVGLPSASLLLRRRTELAVLPEVLAAWQHQGYGFTTLSELIPAE
jgi:peptidoglycan/xylan/chitin deacetylase (PgdA/CDA1 family)